MRHTFNLIRPTADRSTIRLIVSHKGKKYMKSTGISIDTSLWDMKAKGKSILARCKHKGVLKKLSEIHARLIEREPDARTERDVLSAIAYALGEGTTTPSRPSLWPYFKEWSERESPSRRFRELAYKRISDIMGTGCDWEDIDGDWYFRFIRRCDAMGYSHNYKSTLTAKLKTVMNEGFNRGFHTNEAFRKFSTSFKTADTIALTQSEVDALWGAELTGKQADARDCFIVGVYCAGRFQDYSQLSEDNISEDGRLRYTQRKTGQSVVIPCSPRILEVFSRHGGRCPRITEQEVGRHIKKVCEALGGSFLDIVEIRRSEGARIVIEKKRRCDLVSCHTARRSGASILYKSGVPIRVCRFLTGHTTDSMFLNYVKVSKEEGADILAGSEFFM